MVYLYIMINFKKVFTIRALSSALCVLLLCETAVFAMPVSSALRVPVGEKTTYVRINDIQRAEEDKKRKNVISKFTVQAQNLVATAITTTGITNLDISLVGSLARGQLEVDETIDMVDIDIYIEGPTRDPKVRELEDTLYVLAAKMNLDVDVLTYDTVFDTSYFSPEYLAFGQAEGSKSQEEYIQGIAKIKLEREKRIIYRAKKSEELASNQGLKGPFRIKGTDILCYLDEISDRGKIEETLEKWFSSRIGRSFRRGQWEVLMRIHPEGYLAKLETAKGEVLGLAFIRKVQNFIFSMDERTGKDDIAPVYYLDQMEVTSEYRDLGLGEILMAKVIEKVLNDSDIKDRILVTEPANRGTHSADNFFNKIGGAPINIMQEQDDSSSLDDETEWQTRHYVFYRASSENILNMARSQVVPTQLSLFENKDDARLASGHTVFPQEITDKSGNKHSIEKIDPEFYILALPDTDQAISMPSFTLEAINSSL